VPQFSNLTILMIIFFLVLKTKNSRNMKFLPPTMANDGNIMDDRGKKGKEKTIRGWKHEALAKNVNEI